MCSVQTFHYVGTLGICNVFDLNSMATQSYPLDVVHFFHHRNKQPEIFAKALGSSRICDVYLHSGRHVRNKIRISDEFMFDKATDEIFAVITLIEIWNFISYTTWNKYFQVHTTRMFYVCEMHEASSVCTAITEDLPRKIIIRVVAETTMMYCIIFRRPHPDKNAMIKNNCIFT